MKQHINAKIMKKKEKPPKMNHFRSATFKGVRDVIHNDRFIFYLLEEHSNIC